MEAKEINLAGYYLSIDGTLDDKFVAKIQTRSFAGDFYITKNKDLAPRNIKWREQNRKMVECNSYREAMGFAKSLLSIGKEITIKHGNIRHFQINGFKK